MASRVRVALGECAVVELRRSDAQNRKWRALMTDISRCKPEGRELTPDQWSILVFAAWDHDRRFGDLQLMEGLEGRPPVPVNGYSTSLLTVAEMADMITFAIEYAERHGVRWSGGDHRFEDDPIVKQHGRTERQRCTTGGDLHRLGHLSSKCVDCGEELNGKHRDSVIPPPRAFMGAGGRALLGKSAFVRDPLVRAMKDSKR